MYLKIILFNLKVLLLLFCFPFIWGFFCIVFLYSCTCMCCVFVYYVLIFKLTLSISFLQWWSMCISSFLFVASYLFLKFFLLRQSLHHAWLILLWNKTMKTQDYRKISLINWKIPLLNVTGYLEYQWPVDIYISIGNVASCQRLL